MLKIFSTQLSGVMNKIVSQKDEAIEDSARLLAQAITGEGTIYLYCKDELNVLATEALHSLEPIRNVTLWDGTLPENMHPADRFILATRFHDDKEIIDLAKTIQKEHGLVIGISTILDKDVCGLESNVDVHIDLHCKKGLVPDENGNRVGNATSLAALFVLFGIRLSLNEILNELEDY